MTTKRSDQEKSEKYARALIDAARQEGRANKDLVQWNHALKFSPEVLETLAAMRTEDDLNLVGDVARTYKEILDSEDKTVSVTVTTAVPLDDDLREKVIAKAEKDLASVERTLGNQGFVAKAAPEVIEKKRAQAAELTATIDQLKSQIADFE